MAKKIAGYIKLQIPAGKANPSPPVGPALGQRGLNIMQFCKDFNAQTQNMEPGMPVPVVITAYASVDSAVESMKRGAADYLAKPFTPAQVSLAVKKVADLRALEHRLADLQMELEAMRVAAEYAGLAYGDTFEDADLAVDTAGAYVDDAFAHLAGEALQLHGGIGFTWEHDVHLFVRRAKVNQVLYGDAAWHRNRLLFVTELGFSDEART